MSYFAKFVDPNEFKNGLHNVMYWNVVLSKNSSFHRALNIISIVIVYLFAAKAPKCLMAV